LRGGNGGGIDSTTNTDESCALVVEEEEKGGRWYPLLMGILLQLDFVALKEVKEVVETKLVAALDQLAARAMAIR